MGKTGKSADLKPKSPAPLSGTIRKTAINVNQSTKLTQSPIPKLKTPNKLTQV